MTEKDEFSDIFKNFEPKIDSDCDFMSRLSRSLDAVEMVKERNREYVRASRRMAAIAAAAGFAAGVAVMLLLPYFADVFAIVRDWMKSAGMGPMADNAMTLLQALIVIAPTLTVALTVYRTSTLVARHQSLSF
ncbi:MAG: hypothetical protein Q4C34_08880 [Bacteroidales bacterium]|nr:hypothetical protein [Bacteroidales bacterium]